MTTELPTCTRSAGGVSVPLVAPDIQRAVNMFADQLMLMSKQVLRSLGRKHGHVLRRSLPS